MPAGLEQIRRRFELWRGTRRGRRHIPDSLWTAAARAARQFGVNRTCQALRLDYAVLKRRVAAGAAGESTRRAPAPAFVQLLPGGSLLQSECVVELEDPSGGRMRIELKGMSGTDLVALVGSLRVSGA